MADITQEPNGDSNEQPMDAQEEEGPAYERTEQYDKLVEAGINESVAEELDRKLYFTEMLVDGDLDERALDALKEFELEDAKKVIEEFAKSKLQHVSNKSAYLCGVMKVHRQLALSNVAKTADTQNGPDEAKLNAILERTGYSMEVTTGQRKYGGPPPNWGDQPQPGAGHEVFVGKIPRDMFEDELIPLFEESGTIWDLRIMMNPATKLNRGYGFVTFCDKEAANAAVAKLDGHELSNGRTLKVNISVGNVRVFVGNIPKAKSKEEIQEEFNKIVEELSDVIVYADSNNPKNKNRGFAFLDFANHKAASAARRKLISGKYKIWGSITPAADWADPQTEPDAETMAKVKVLYVSNLSSDVTEEMLKTKFEPYGTVERVKKPENKDYGFVHFEKREDAVSAMEDLNNQKLGENEMNIKLAKPTQTNKRKEMRRMRGGPGGFDGHGGYGGYGGMGGGYDGYGGPMYRGYGGFDNHYGGYYDYYGYGRGRGRGMGRGGPGGPMRGFHGGPGMMRGGGMRGGGFRGGRGGPRGGPRGGGGYNGARAGKRKFGGDNQQQAKRRPTDQSWGSQPIAQQPMQDFGGNNQWYQDSFNSSW